MAIIPLVPEDQMGPEMQALLEVARSRGTPTPRFYQALANQPEVMKGFGQLWAAVFYGGTLETDLKELVRRFLASRYQCGN